MNEMAVKTHSRKTKTRLWQPGDLGIDGKGRWFVTARQSTIDIAGQSMDSVAGLSLIGIKQNGTYAVAHGSAIAALTPLDRASAQKDIKDAIAKLKDIKSTPFILNASRRESMFADLKRQLDNNTPSDIVAVLQKTCSLMIKQVEADLSVSIAVNDIYNRAAYAFSYWIHALFGANLEENYKNFEAFRQQKFKNLTLTYTAAKQAANMDSIPAEIDLSWVLEQISDPAHIQKLHDAHARFPDLAVYYGVGLIPADKRPSVGRIADALDLDADQVHARMADARRSMDTLEPRLPKYMPQPRRIEASRPVNSVTPPAHPAPVFLSAAKAHKPEITKPASISGKRDFSKNFNVDSVEDFEYFRIEHDHIRRVLKYRIEGTDILINTPEYNLLSYIKMHQSGTMSGIAAYTQMRRLHIVDSMKKLSALFAKAFTALNIEGPLPLDTNDTHYHYYKKGEQRQALPIDTPPVPRRKSSAKPKALIEHEFIVDEVIPLSWMTLEVNHSLKKHNCRIFGTEIRCSTSVYQALQKLDASTIAVPKNAFDPNTWAGVERILKSVLADTDTVFPLIQVAPGHYYLFKKDEDRNRPIDLPPAIVKISDFQVAQEIFLHWFTVEVDTTTGKQPHYRIKGTNILMGETSMRLLQNLEARSGVFHLTAPRAELKIPVNNDLAFRTLITHLDNAFKALQISEPSPLVRVARGYYRYYKPGDDRNASLDSLPAPTTLNKAPQEIDAPHFNVTKTQDFGYFTVETDETAKHKAHRIAGTGFFLTPDAVKVLRVLAENSGTRLGNAQIQGKTGMHKVLISRGLRQLQDVLTALWPRLETSDPMAIETLNAKYCFYKPGMARRPRPLDGMTTNMTEDFGYFSVETNNALSKKKHRIAGTDRFIMPRLLSVLRYLAAHPNEPHAVPEIATALTLSNHEISSTLSTLRDDMDTLWSALGIKDKPALVKTPQGYIFITREERQARAHRFSFVETNGRLQALLGDKSLSLLPLSAKLLQQTVQQPGAWHVMRDVAKAAFGEKMPGRGEIYRAYKQIAVALAHTAGPEIAGSLLHLEPGYVCFTPAGVAVPAKPGHVRAPIVKKDPPPQPDHPALVEEKKRLSGKPGLRAIFNIAAAKLDPRRAQIVTQLYLRADWQRLTVEQVAQRHKMNVRTVQRLAASGQQSLLQHLDDDAHRKIVAAWAPRP